MEVSNRGLDTIKRWEHRAKVNRVIYAELCDGVIVQEFKVPVVEQEKKPLPDIKIPDNYDAKWVADCYKSGISKRQLSFMLKCSRAKITRLLKKAEYTIPQEIINIINEL
jgi:hypothetical protein